MTDSDKAWQQWGIRNPYYGVCSDERFRTGRLDRQARELFFRSGEEHVDAVLATIRQRLNPNFHPSSALDFGCGVGRVLPALARRCHRVVGADVSTGMLEESRRNMESMNLANVELVQSDDEISRLGGAFDLIHSFIVFQHIPTRRGTALLGRLLTHLNDGGAVAVQFVYRRSSPIGPIRQAFKVLSQRSALINRAVNVVRGVPVSDPPMQMNLYNINELLAVFYTGGVRDIFVSLQEDLGYLSVEFYGVKLT